MTPDRRLDQLEPLVADGLQKIDRLIEGQGQIISEVSKIPAVEKNTDTTARGLAKLTLSVQEGFARVDDKVDQLKTEVSDLRTEMNQRFDQIIELLRQR